MGFMDYFKSGSSSSSTDWGGLIETGLKVYNDYTAGKEAERGMRSSASTAGANAGYLAQKATDTNAIGSREAAEFGRKGRLYQGTQRAAQGASGVVAGAGTFADVERGTAEQLREDQATMLRNTMREAYGYQLQSGNYSAAQSEAGRAADSMANTTKNQAVGSIASATYAEGLKRKWWEE